MFVFYIDPKVVVDMFDKGMSISENQCCLWQMVTNRSNMVIAAMLVFRKITCQEGTNTSILIQFDILRKLRFRNFDYIDGNIIFECSYKIYSKITMSYVHRQ